MRPFYANQKWKSETAFIDFLEKSENVKWWFKNGDRDMTFFAVPYSNGEKKPFYVDFIVMLKDGQIGLFDPHGMHLSDFQAKNDGLREYIQEQSKEEKKLFGGIVANTDQRKYKGKWIYFDKPSKDFKKDFFDNWKNFNL